MTIQPTVRPLVEEIIAALAASQWNHDPEIDEMEITLLGSAGREGLWHDVDDYTYLRVDVETGQPLSLTIYPFHAWFVEQTRPGNSLPRETSIDLAKTRKHLERVLRASPDLAGR